MALGTTRGPRALEGRMGPSVHHRPPLRCQNVPCWLPGSWSKTEFGMAHAQLASRGLLFFCIFF